MEEMELDNKTEKVGQECRKGTKRKWYFGRGGRTAIIPNSWIVVRN